MLRLSRVRCEPVVSVPAKVTARLRQWHIDAVRFLYDSYRRGENAMLNHDGDMNEPRQVAAFMSALAQFPVLIFCSDDAVTKWYYELSLDGNATVNVLTSSNADRLTESADFHVVLVPFSNLKYVRPMKTVPWFMFVVDGLESVVKSNYVKKVTCKFKLGITRHNFMSNPNYNLKFKMVKWLDPELTHDEETFTKIERNALANLQRSPFATWQRHTWRLYEVSRPTDAQVTAYNENVANWITENAPSLLTRCTNKRKNRSATQTRSKKKRPSTSIELKTQLDSFDEVPKCKMTYTEFRQREPAQMDPSVPSIKIAQEMIFALNTRNHHDPILDSLFTNDVQTRPPVGLVPLKEESDSENDILKALFDESPPETKADDSNNILDMLFT